MQWSDSGEMQDNAAMVYFKVQSQYLSKIPVEQKEKMDFMWLSQTFHLTKITIHPSDVKNSARLHINEHKITQYKLTYIYHAFLYINPLIFHHF